MANYTVTASLVFPSAAGKLKSKRGIAGEAITAGQPLYLTAANTLKLATAASTGLQHHVVGIAMDNAATGQAIVYATFDLGFDLGTAITDGATIVLSATAGRLCPDADIVTSGHYKVVIGVGIGGTEMTLRPLIGGAI